MLFRSTQSKSAFAFFAWPHRLTSTPRREIGQCPNLRGASIFVLTSRAVFIYSCPSSSPVKDRMLYSCSCVMLFKSAEQVLAAEGGSTLASRKIETSDPSELNEKYLASELGLTSVTGSEASGASTPIDSGERKPFARPKGPGKRR